MLKVVLREGIEPSKLQILSLDTVPFVTKSPEHKMVRMEGFEPPTPWFEAKYSIQLSYTRINGGR
jgi:hypothetical protein